MTIADATTRALDQSRLKSGAQRLPCPERAKPWVLGTAILGSSVVFIEGSVVNLALPPLQADLAATSTDVQWVINAYLLVLGAFMLIGGSLGDRYGLRRVFVLGAGVFGAAALACALAPSLSWLLAARVVQGLGGALLVPASLALISHHFSEAERGRAIGSWAGASALTTAIGPVIGGWLVDQWGWPAVFLLVAPLAIIAVAIALWRIPSNKPVGSEVPDFRGAVLLATSLALLIVAMVYSGFDWTRLVILVFAILLGVAFLHRERHCRSPMLPLELFRSRSFTGANLMTLLLYFALNGVFYFLPFNLVQVQGWSVVAAGAAFLPFTLIMGFGSTFAGDLIRSIEARRILTVGPMIAALGFLALAVPGTDARFVTGFLPGIVLIGIGMTLSVAPLTTVVMNAVHREHAGTASGVNNTAARIAGVLAIAGLTSVAITVFAAIFEAHLHDAGVPPGMIAPLVERSALLAELAAPAGTPHEIASRVNASVATAYVQTFRVLVIVCGVLSAGSGLIAWYFLPSGRRAATKDEEES